LDGTGFEKVQIVQTQVAVLAGVGSMDAALSGLPERGRGDAAPVREGLGTRAGERDCREARFVTFGIKVIFADDFRNPACPVSRQQTPQLRLSPLT